jgi:hypothetical protein
MHINIILKMIIEQPKYNNIKLSDVFIYHTPEKMGKYDVMSIFLQKH